MGVQIVRQKRTLIKFAVRRTTYVAGKGAVTSWTPIRVRVGTDDDGSDIMTDCFYCEWLGSYGSAAIQQQADGVIRPARVRMTYVGAVYNALINEDVRIYLHGIADEAHTFVLASAADNYMETNKMLEFQVKRYEAK